MLFFKEFSKANWKLLKGVYTYEQRGHSNSNNSSKTLTIVFLSTQSVLGMYFELFCVMFESFKVIKKFFKNQKNRPRSQISTAKKWKQRSICQVYKYEVNRTKTHEIRAESIGPFFCPSLQLCRSVSQTQYTLLKVNSSLEPLHVLFFDKRF